MQIRIIAAALALAISGAAFADNGGHRVTVGELTDGSSASVTKEDFSKACAASDKASLVCLFKGLPQGKNTRKCSQATNKKFSVDCIAEAAVTMQVYTAIQHNDYAGQYPALVAALATQGIVDSKVFQDTEIATGAWTTTATFISKLPTQALGELLHRAAVVNFDPARHEESAEEGESDSKRYPQGW